MKICAVICEYNPFHNGHLYQLQEAKKQSCADAILCIMSGNFVQRGEAAILDKFTRAKHAVLGGADAVVELPTVFATANAELFAKGAVSLLSSIPSITHLCFGAENPNAEAFLKTAALLNNEPEEVSLKIKLLTSEGMSYAKARAKAWEGVADNTLLSSPNNILGVEYTRAILEQGANIEILPIQRVGGGYHNHTIEEAFSSASAIRSAIESGEDFSKALPDFTQMDLPSTLQSQLELLEKHAVISRTSEEIARVCDCTEGLENAFKKAALQTAPLSETLTSARYTASRIRRIALQNLLRIEEAIIRKALHTPLYLRVLGLKKNFTEVLSALSESNSPLIIRAHDEEVLSGVAAQVFGIDVFAEQIYKLLYPQTSKQPIFY